MQFRRTFRGHHCHSGRGSKGKLDDVFLERIARVRSAIDINREQSQWFDSFLLSAFLSHHFPIPYISSKRPSKSVGRSGCLAKSSSSSEAVLPIPTQHSLKRSTCPHRVAVRHTFTALRVERVRWNVPSPPCDDISYWSLLVAPNHPNSGSEVPEERADEVPEVDILCC